MSACPLCKGVGCPACKQELTEFFAQEECSKKNKDISKQEKIRREAQKHTMIDELKKVSHIKKTDVDNRTNNILI
jgi:hypothetical protein